MRFLSRTIGVYCVLMEVIGCLGSLISGSNLTASNGPLIMTKITVGYHIDSKPVALYLISSLNNFEIVVSK